ncbi:MAG TPA: DNA alkylation response protein, partial [Rhizobacter sp.]|nr:DNA alkylation response protein [Rhizobacter sp.]
MGSTHEVFNQPEPLVGYNLFAGNRPLQDALRFNAPALHTAELAQLGETLGRADMQAHARLANVHPPQLITHDRSGRRVDRVEFHPSYHVLMHLAAHAGLHGSPWAESATQPHAHVRRAAGFMLFTELEPSTLCPISMTYAVTPALRGNPAIAAEWEPMLTKRHYDGRFVAAPQKNGVTLGMGMTEKQGGSDVRANTTQATPDGSDAWGQRYRLL